MRRNRSQPDVQVIARPIKPHPWARTACRIWEVVCALLLAISAALQVRLFVFSSSPATAGEIVGWLCFDVLFLLGAYAGYDLLCDDNCKS